MSAAAAIALCVALFGLGAFQLLLVAGAPMGHFAWGGQHRVLPSRHRAGSILSTLVYAAFAVVVLDRACLISVLPAQITDFAIWVVAGILLLSTIPNVMSRSVSERALMAPLALALSCLTVVVALQ